MSNDNKTLADVQPGGRVRLGDRPKDGEVIVEVFGLTGSGKSAIAGEIEILCKALGLEVEWVNGDEEKCLTHADWIGALEMYKPKVMILERNVSRSPDTRHQACEPSLATAARAAIPFVAYAFSEGVDGAEEAGRAIEAALSAQPSPGGQGDAHILPPLATERMLDAGWPCGEVIDRTFDRQGAYADLVAAAPAIARQPVGEPVELACVAETLANGAGLWMTCSGCHESNEGAPTGPYSTIMQCHLGHGCDECGGIGAIWDTTDYQQMADEMAKSLAAPPAQAVDLGTGVKAIAAERERQLQTEGFTRDGDQQYRRGELAKAATAYVQLAAMDLEAGTRNHIAWHGPAAVWPWAPEWWKPVDARRDLVRAGALIAAQIDLIDSQAMGRE